MKTTSVILLISIAIGLISSQSINSVSSYSGKSYAFDGFPFLSGSDTFTPHAYEITNGAITNTFALSGITGTHTSSSLIAGNNLYQFHGAYGTGFLSKYTLPFATSNPSPSSQVEFASHLMVPGIIDTTDGIAVAIITRNINLVDLNTFTITHTLQAIPGSKKSPGCLVYNQAVHKVYFFIKHYCAWGNCQHIQEYTVSNGQLTQVEESFTPDYNTGFNNGHATGCKLDSANGNIWCLSAVNSQLQRFSVANLNSNSVYSLPSTCSYTDGNIAFDFDAHKAFIVGETLSGITIMEYSLNTLTITRQVSFVGVPVVSVSLGASNAKLFLGHDNVDANPELSTLDIASFTVSHLSL